jgi:hypothetical protein
VGRRADAESIASLQFDKINTIFDIVVWFSGCPLHLLILGANQPTHGCAAGY